MSYLTIEQAKSRYGKSESTIRRMARKILRGSHPNPDIRQKAGVVTDAQYQEAQRKRQLIKPDPKTTADWARQRRALQWEFHESLLDEEFGTQLQPPVPKLPKKAPQKLPPAQIESTQPTLRENAQSPRQLYDEMIHVLKESHTRELGALRAMHDRELQTLKGELRAERQAAVKREKRLLTANKDDKYLLQAANENMTKAIMYIGGGSNHRQASEQQSSEQQQRKFLPADVVEQTAEGSDRSNQSEPSQADEVDEQVPTQPPGPPQQDDVSDADRRSQPSGGKLRQRIADIYTKILAS